MHEVMEMLRKFMLMGIVVFYAPETVDQVLLAMLISGAFMVYHVKYQPFKADEEDNIQSCSLVTTTVTLALAISMQSANASVTVTTMLMALNIGSVLYVMFMMIPDLMCSRR